jgi:hypothetical protein
LQKCVSRRCNGYVHHGWLTPAALGARCSFAAKALFATDKRTFTGAVGVSLPWLGERDDVPRESNIVQRLASTRSRAAGVSPPWLGNVLAVMNAVCERERSPTTAGSRQPLLIASRTSLHKCVSCRCNGCVHHGWLTPAALDCKPDAVAEVCFPPVQRLRSPRLAHASRSWCTVFVRCQSAICDGQTHIHRSGGRQPAVARKRIGGHERFFANRNARPPRLAHASRSWCTVFVRCQSAICDGQTHIHRSGGR